MIIGIRAAWLPVLALALLAGCSKSPGGGTGPAGEEKVVNVYNWSDYIDPSVVPAFEKEYGIKVHYDVFDSNEVLETKLLTGHTNYDIVVPSGAFLERQIKAGVYQKLDKSQIPNLAGIDLEVTRATAQYDPGNEYAVDYMWITSGAGYDPAKITARLAGAPVDSLALFYDPKILARFKDCGVSVLDAPTEVVASVLYFLGKDPNSEKPEDLKAAEQVLTGMRPYLRYVHSSRYIDDLANGETCLAFGWSGDIKQAHDRAKEAGKGIDVRYALPKEGAISNYDVLAIPKDAPHPRNAHLFINYLLRPEVAAKNTNFLKYANPVSASLPLIDETVRTDPGVYPPPEARAKMVPERAKTPEFTRLLTRMWTRFKTGQ